MSGDDMRYAICNIAYYIWHIAYGPFHPLETVIWKMIFRSISEGDIPQLVWVMVETRGSVAGTTSPAALRALCRDACRNRKPPCLMIVIAEEERGIAGYVVAVIGGADYWRGFARRHPLAAARILWKRAIKRFVRLWRATPPTPRPVASPAPVAISASESGRTWQDRGLNIARVQQIAVHPYYRGRGVGTRLYEQLFATARRLGVNRVDAHIDLNNDASVALHRRSGWTVVKLRGHFFATIAI